MKLGASHAVALFLGAVGAVGVQSIRVAAPDQGYELKLVNMELSFADLPDGGSHVAYRACAYQNKLDGGARLAEPCWRGDLHQVGFVPEVLGDGLRALDRAR